ncbi:hypothetical protein GC173_02460 [bacterium]|nr:hypothetical protein [bacterium]
MSPPPASMTPINLALATSRKREKVILSRCVERFYNPPLDLYPSRLVVPLATSFASLSGQGMDKDFLQNPHDRMFRELFTRLDSAAGFLREVIPRAVSERCSWEELQIVPGTWVDEEFNEFESDLLYRVPMQGGELGLYVLLEHQSTPDRWMPLRLLIYMTRIWQEMRKQGTTDGWLAPVMPIVVYQGARRWEVPTSLGELFALSDEAREGLAPFLPAFEYALFDLSHTTAIPGGIETRVVLDIMRAVMQGREAYLKALEGASGPMQEMLNEERTALLIEKLLRYALLVDSKASRLDVKMILETSPGALKEKTMSIAEELIQEGLEKGIQQGIEEGMERGLCAGLRRSICRLARIRFGDDRQIAGALEKISDPMRLEDLHALAATARTLDELVAALR